MNLHNNPALYKEAIRFTAQEKNLQPAFIEKDYWVTYVLFKLFNNEIGGEVIFKGGTALSKCYHMIERFSEDIDLVIIRRLGETDNQLKSKLKTISALVGTELPEIPVKGLTRKMGMNRKTAHGYNKTFDGNFGQIRDLIILESSWLGYHEPYISKSIVSYVGQIMLKNNQMTIVEETGLLPFEIRTLYPTRTICEKIMSLVRFSHSKSPLEDLKNKIRHTYDLHQIMQNEDFIDFIHSKSFDEMMLKVALDDQKSFRGNNKWLEQHPKEALIFKNLDRIWDELKPTYLGSFKNLVYGKLPDPNAVKQSLQIIGERLKEIDWPIKG